MKLLSVVLISVYASLCAAVAHGTHGEVTPFPPTTPWSADDANNRLPKLIEEVEAIYPPEVKAQQLEDEVYVAFVVEKTGAVTNVRAFFSRHTVFEEAAVAAVKRWKFSPGLHEGHIVRTRMVVPILFRADKP